MVVNVVLDLSPSAKCFAPSAPILFQIELMVDKVLSVGSNFIKTFILLKVIDLSAWILCIIPSNYCNGFSFPKVLPYFIDVMGIVCPSMPLPNFFHTNNCCLLKFALLPRFVCHVVCLSFGMLRPLVVIFKLMVSTLLASPWKYLPLPI